MIVEPLTQDDIEHREDFHNFVLNKARPWHRKHLGRLYELWAEWNGTFFESRLTVPYILLAEPPAPNRYGDCATTSCFGGRAQICIRPKLLTGEHPHVREGQEYAEGRFQFVADVLLHESIHHLHNEVTGDTEDSQKGHGPAFRDKCNEIGAALGLKPVRTAKRRGKDERLPSCTQWPHNVRPPDYYQGAYVPPGGDDNEESDEERRARERRGKITRARQDLEQAVRAYGWARLHGLSGDRSDEAVRRLDAAKDLVLDEAWSFFCTEVLGFAVDESTFRQSVPPPQLSAGVSSRIDVPPCFAALGLSWPCMARDVKRAFASKAKKVHPDCGGDDASFIELHAVYKQAMRFVEAAENQQCSSEEAA